MTQIQKYEPPDHNSDHSTCIKSSISDEYAKRGGLFGMAMEKLRVALTDAAKDPVHYLRPVIEAFSRKAKLKHLKLLGRALDSAHEDDGLELAIVAKTFRLPLAAAQMEREFRYLEMNNWSGPIAGQDLEDVHKEFLRLKRLESAQQIKSGAQKGGRTKSLKFKKKYLDKYLHIRNLAAHSVSKMSIADRTGLSRRRIDQILKK